jgi:hypothetical protein
MGAAPGRSGVHTRQRMFAHGCHILLLAMGIRPSEEMRAVSARGEEERTSPMLVVSDREKKECLKHFKTASVAFSTS